MARLAQRGERQRVDWARAASAACIQTFRASKRQAHNLFIGSKIKALPSFISHLQNFSTQILPPLSYHIVQTNKQHTKSNSIQLPIFVRSHPNILQLNRLQIESSSSVVFCYEWYQPCRPIVLRSKAKARGRACPKESICSTSQFLTFASSSTRPTKVAPLT